MRSAVASPLVCLVAVCFAAPGEEEHTIEIEVKASEGKVSAHFARCDGGLELKPIVDANGTMREMKAPTAKRKDKNIKAREGESPIVTGEPWKEKFTVSGDGVYVLRLSAWQEKSNASVKLIIDGEVRFEGSGSKDDIEKWAYKKYAGKTRKTDDLEVCVDLKK